MLDVWGVRMGGDDSVLGVLGNRNKSFRYVCMYNCTWTITKLKAIEFNYIHVHQVLNTLLKIAENLKKNEKSFLIQNCFI